MDSCRCGAACWRPLCPYVRAGRRARRWALLLATQEEEDLEVIKVILEERIPKHIVDQTIVEQNVDVPMTQVMKDTLEPVEGAPKERMSECTPEQFFDAFDEPVPHFRDDPMVKQKLQAKAKEIVSTRSEKSESRADSAQDTQNCCGQRYKFDQDVSDNGKEWAAAFPRCLQDDGSAVDLAERQDRVSAASAALEVRLVPQKRISERTQIVDVPVLHSAQPVDQPGDQACRVSADSIHRQVSRHACGDVDTGSERTQECGCAAVSVWCVETLFCGGDVACGRTLRPVAAFCPGHTIPQGKVRSRAPSALCRPATGVGQGGS